MKFIRRKDLDTSTRLNIIIAGLSCVGIYGGMTKLALQYNISRTFLYQLMGTALLCLTEILSVESRDVPSHQMDAESLIVLLRLEGKCSISSISEILTALNYPFNSTGMISQLLSKYGKILPDTLSSSEEHQVVYLCDEIFARGCPILITIEPKSTAILKIELAPNRSAKSWQNHYEQLSRFPFFGEKRKPRKLNQFIAKALVSDRGKGITGGYESVYPQLPWYSDHFHEFRGLFKLLNKFERQAYAAIDYEHDRLCKFDNARSESNLEKRLKQYEQAAQVCSERIDLHQQFSDALSMLIPSLYFFNNEGQPNYRRTVKDDILTIISFLEELQNKQINEQTTTIMKHIDDIINCYQQVEDIYQNLSTKINLQPLNYLCLAWQHQHLANQTFGSSKYYHQDELNFWLNCVESLLDNQAETTIKQVFDSLDEMVRSSSLIEMVNSLIRPYLNSCKGQITQETLNIIMFFHNHRPYKTGKRKGITPIEILTQTKLDKHWIESLFEQALL
jgi:DNA-binding phage protein